jgi:hypothetical protein
MQASESQSGKAASSGAANPLILLALHIGHLPAIKSGMTLLVTSSHPSESCISALQKACGEPIELAHSGRTALASLRDAQYTAAIIDESLMDPDPFVLETLTRHPGTTIPIYVNLAISGIDRLVRDVQTALRRSEHQQAVARRTAIARLRSELNSTLTGILLSSQLALGVPGLPPDAEAKLRSVEGMAQTLRKQLESSSGA